MEVDFFPGHAHQFDSLFDFGVSLGFREHLLENSGVNHEELMYLIILFYDLQNMMLIVYYLYSIILNYIQENDCEKI